MKKGAVSVRANRLFPATRTKDKLHCYYRYYRARLVKEKERERERERERVSERAVWPVSVHLKGRDERRRSIRRRWL